ncbi:MAG: hypothetical protein IPL61_33660 [Myxococcales bacterium]|nr:hypothetical protein [Myxococcales bacterium]
MDRLTPRRALRATLAATAVVALLGCGGDDAPTVRAGADVVVTALAGEHVYFGDPNRRAVDVAVAFPEAGLRYQQVTLRIGLGCPTGGCDWWDRLGHLALVTPATATAPERELELARFITPYRVGAELTVDVTDLQRVLEGERTLRVFIDTWVGPGHANGAGWLVDASFEFIGGLPTPDPVAVVPLWAPQRVVYGDPLRPSDVTATVDVPAGTTAVRVRSLVTGHGQGNADNCAEFCARDHTVAIADQLDVRSIWRADCATTAAPGQQGSWQYPRAGWCPGAIVAPWITDAAPAAGPITIRYDVAAYENTCRPDAPTCAGCALGTGCDYDGGAHTEPGWEQSAVLILYR